MKGSNSKKLKKISCKTKKNLRQTFPGNNSNNSFLAFVESYPPLKTLHVFFSRRGCCGKYLLKSQSSQQLQYKN